MSKGLGLAVVGYAQTARLHTGILAAAGHDLRWLVGRVPERSEAFAREFGFARHTLDLHEALEDPAVDAVFLFTPSPQHAAQAAVCLDAGKHVMVEVPLAMSYAEGVRLAETARERGLILMVGHSIRYQGAIERVRERVVRGDLTVQNIIARYTLMRRQNRGTDGYERSWTDNIIWHHGLHAMDIVLWLMGVDGPGSVDVNATIALPHRSMGVPLDLTVALRTRSEQLATVAVTHNSYINLSDFVVMATEETLVIEHGSLRNQDTMLYQPKEHDGELGRMHQDEDFFAAIREGRPPRNTAESVLAALEVAQLAQDSWNATRAVGATHPAGPPTDAVWLAGPEPYSRFVLPSGSPAAITA